MIRLLLLACMFIILVVPEAWSGAEAEKEEPHRWL